MPRPPAWTVHPLLLAICPGLWLYAHNLAKVHPASVVAPVLAGLLFTAAVFGVGLLITRNRPKAAVIASLSIVMLTQFRAAQEAWQGLTGAPLPMPVMLAAWLVIWVGLVVLIARVRDRLPALSQGVVVASAVLVVFAGLPIARFHLRPRADAAPIPLDAATREWAGRHRASQQPCPDVYYIVLDGYGRADQILRHYDFDNRAFGEALAQRGFFIAESATSNYTSTNASLISSLNMEYIQTLRERVPPGTLSNQLEYNRVAQTFQALGYRYALVRSGAVHTDQSRLADVTLDSGALKRSSLLFMLVDMSALRFALRISPTAWDRLRDAAVGTGFMSDPTGLTQWHQHITRSLEMAAEQADDPAPTFTFAHVLCPHPPYVLRRDGSVNTDATVSDGISVDQINAWRSPMYVDQLVHLNRLLLATIDTILARSDEPPIIILQGDHGTFSLAEPGVAKEDQPITPDAVAERTAILLACRAPFAAEPALTHDATPVNLFRAVFREQFGADLPPLDNRNYWSFRNPMPDITTR